jgi:protein ImuB
MPRVMCVHFPLWSLQRIWHHQPDLRGRPLALTRPVANQGGKVAACCQLAHAHGVRPGMLQAEAVATAPALICLEEDLDADRQALTQLAEWAQRFSPIVGLEDGLAPTCLFIDTTGCAACFGGEELMVQSASAEFSKNGWTVVITLADTLGAAWALAHYGAEGEGRLLDLPVAALRLSAGTVALLGQLGIERIGQLSTLPRDQIAERFGAEVGLRLDQASGRIAEVITPFHPPPEAAASWVFDDPVERHEIVAKVLDLLLERLQAILEKRHCGARVVECVLELDGAKAQRFECSLSRPARTASYLNGLLRTRLEQIRVQAPIRAMCVSAVVLERFAHEQPRLFDAAGEADEAALAQLLDSLASRLGKEAVTAARFHADPQPELACRFVSALDCGTGFQSCHSGETMTGLESCPTKRGPGRTNAEDSQVFVHRPLRMFPRPIPIQVVTVVPSGMVQRFHGAGVDHAVVRCQGPERIETGWWRGADIQRDYFMVETIQGTRWWIFQRLNDGRWFLHGCFD